MTTVATPAAGSFVINLCSSTTPMALRIPVVPELKRFAFFVSRRREEGRERFRLHMGHFATLAEAEEWLGIVRDLYPGAWAGEAPGRKLRAAQEAAAANAGLVSSAAAAAATSPSASPPIAAAPPVATPSARPPAPAPVAAPAVRPPARTPAPVQRRVSPAPSKPSPPSPPAAARPVRSHAQAPAWPSSAGRMRRDGSHAAPPNAPPADGIPVVQAARFAASAPARAAAKPPVPAAAKPSAPTVAKPSTVPAAKPSAAPPPTAGTVQSNLRQVLADLDAEEPGLSDTQVLSMLERRRDAAAAAGAPSAPLVGTPEEIQLLRPDDVSTMTELRHGLSANRQVAFAVQLEWSVRPIELKRVPPLAIFSAYTLYTVEGNREGRKWFGLRLGFFSDSISAKQVALYVRSEFKSVAVIPVSDREKTRATEDGRLSPSALGHAQHKEKPPEEFKLIDSTGERPALPASAATPAAAAGPRKDEPVKTARRNARRKTVEESLEETLEILGAGELSLDDGRKPLINDTALRPSVSTDSGTGTFAKLLERLSDRLVRGR